MRERILRPVRNLSLQWQHEPAHHLGGERPKYALAMPSPALDIGNLNGELALGGNMSPASESV